MKNTNTPKERPILFSGPMVRAILAGRKTQTRRILKRKGGHAGLDGMCPRSTNEFVDIIFRELEKECPYGQPGDRLWVKETHTLAVGDVLFRATDLDDPLITPETKWKPSIFMRRKYSRITLEITAVCVERLQDITEQDAIAEGCYRMDNGLFAGEPHRIKGTPTCCTSPRIAYERLWKSINGPESWSANPWVWVVEFRKI